MNRKRKPPKAALLKKTEILVLAASLLAVSACSRAPKVAVQKYNIILFAVDTLRADHIGCYGYESADTPHIDAFAKDSLFFQNAFCPIPKTSASFASMLTGLHPFIHKTKPNRGAIDARFLTLAELLGGQGYRTAAIVDNANLSSAFAFNQGFDSYTEVWKYAPTKEQSTPFITAKVSEFLNNPGPKPFFLWVNYIEPHVPYLPPARFVRPARPGRDIRQVKHRLITRRVWREMEKNQNFDENYYISLYDGTVRYIDAEFGRIVDACRRGGLEKNTILIFTADHGEDLGERNFFFEHGTLTFTAGARVPMLVRIPGIKARKTKTPVSVMDVYPTVLECLGLKAPYELQGVSLLRPQKDRLLYIVGIGSQAVVRNDWHYIGLSPKTSKRLGLAPNHFHNLIDDPRETNNRFKDKAGQALALAGKYAAFLKQHGYLTRPRTKTVSKKLSAEEKKSLETLGYL